MVHPDFYQSVVALKCYNMDRRGYSVVMRQWQFLLTELQAYSKLQHLQGQVVPHLLFVSVHGPLVYLGLDLCDEVMPDDISRWSDVDRLTMQSNLQKMQQHGVVQNDVRGANFGKRSGRLLCFDLEDCHTASPPNFRTTSELLDANKENVN